DGNPMAVHIVSNIRRPNDPSDSANSGRTQANDNLIMRFDNDQHRGDIPMDLDPTNMSFLKCDVQERNLSLNAIQQSLIATPNGSVKDYSVEDGKPLTKQVTVHTVTSQVFEN
ncbi:hypothetical protein MJO29_016781, partial [Puccinia striiformis f. sp. tritici]